MKCKIGLDRNTPWGIEEDVELITAMCDAVGDNVRIMADANQAYDRTEAEWIGWRLTDHDVYYFEEPIPVEDVEGYARLNETLMIPIAAGECWAFTREFERAIRSSAVSYVQPDIPSAGEITTAHEVARLAHDNNVPCVPHVWRTAISIAAGLQLIATIPGQTMSSSTGRPIRSEMESSWIPLKARRTWFRFLMALALGSRLIETR